jgi:hypothetical protein
MKQNHPPDDDKEEKTSVGVRIPAAMAAEMKRLAKTQDISLSQILKWAVGAFVEYYEATDGKFLNAEAMRRIIAEKFPSPRDCSIKKGASGKRKSA